MKRLTPKIKTTTSELYDVQRAIAKLKAQLKALEGVEAELVEKLTPVYESPEGVSENALLIAGMNFTVKYRLIERSIVNAEAVAKVFKQLGKRVPMKQISYSTLKVAKS